MASNDIQTGAFIALDSLLEYAKYLEDNHQLSYDLLKERVQTFKDSSKKHIDIQLINHNYVFGTVDGVSYTIVPRA